MTEELMPLCACGHEWALHVVPGGIENIDIYPIERRCVDCACRDYRAETPTAGDLLIRAVDKWASHGMGCDLDDCAPCIRLINQLRLAYKVWQSSAHKFAAAPVHADRLRVVAENLYRAGRWSAPNVSDAEAAALWEALRDALGLPQGTATALGVNSLAVRRSGADDGSAR